MTATSQQPNYIMHPQDSQSHGPSAPSFSARLQAATALSRILSVHDIPHAFIGGFAFNLLGTTRSTLDIDVIIEDSAFSPALSISTTLKTGKSPEPIHFDPATVRQVGRKILFGRKRDDPEAYFYGNTNGGSDRRDERDGRDEPGPGSCRDAARWPPRFASASQPGHDCPRCACPSSSVPALDEDQAVHEFLGERSAPIGGEV